MNQPLWMKTSASDDEHMICPPATAGTSAEEVEEARAIESIGEGRCLTKLLFMRNGPERSVAHSTK